jgi:SnoaL-like protein
MTNMSTNPLAQKMERMVSAYFEACAKQDANAIAACFAPGGVHYFPHHRPLLDGAAIGAAIVEDLRNRGGQYFIDKILSDVEQRAAAVEWSRTFHQSDRILRGYELYEFDPSSTLIREIRGYYAAAPNPDKARHEIAGFDYEGRGYKILS